MRLPSKRTIFKLRFYKCFKKRRYSLKGTNLLAALVKALRFLFTSSKYLIHVYQILDCYLLQRKEIPHHYFPRVYLDPVLPTYRELCHLQSYKYQFRLIIVIRNIRNGKIVWKHGPNRPFYAFMLRTKLY